MRIYELKEHLYCYTPKGTGTIWLVTDYGTEIEKIFTVILTASGDVWEFTNKDIQIDMNLTMGRGKWGQRSTLEK